MTRSLVVGATGEIGGALMRALPGEVIPTARRPLPGHLLLDLADPPADLPSVDVAFLCAAQASIHACAADPAGTAAINVAGTIALARRLVKGGTFVVFCSTNQVFDGSVPRPPAGAPPSPRTEYGRQKVAAEQALLALGPNVAIVRLTKVLGDRWPAPEGWARALIAGQAARPFAEMPVAPVSMDRVIAGLRQVADDRLAGIGQLSASHDITYPEIARALASRLAVAPNLVLPGPPDPPLEHLPAYASLDSSRLDALLGPAPDPWDAVSPILARITSTVVDR